MSLKLYLEHSFWPKSCSASAPSQFHLEYNERKRFLLETHHFFGPKLSFFGCSAYLIGLPPVLTSSQAPTPRKLNISFLENYVWKTFSFPLGANFQGGIAGNNFQGISPKLQLQSSPTEVPPPRLQIGKRGGQVKAWKVLRMVE